MEGLFITLEGPDGSGKSTITKLIGDYLEEKGIEYIVTREPGGTDIGEDIRDIILDNKNTKMGPETEALLYAASRGQHIHEKILPALEEGKLIICDRFLLSSLAYQGIARGLGVEEVKSINDFALRGIKPDKILFFHIDPEVSLKRKTAKLGGDRLEKEGEEFHNRVYNGYMDLVDLYPENIKVIDATKTVEEVFDQCIKEIEELLISREG